MSNAYKPVSPFGHEDRAQNFCVKFTHSFSHYASNPRTRFENHFVVKGAPIDFGIALEMTKMMFPTYTDIKIESIEHDENALTPSEYYFIQGKLNEEFHARMESAAKRREAYPDIADMWDEHREEKEYNEYLLMLIKKMQARMDQFPTYHT